MIIEILIGIGLAIGLYWLQDRTSKDVKKMTERIDKLTQQKAKAEQDKSKSTSYYLDNKIYDSYFGIVRHRK